MITVGISFDLPHSWSTETLEEWGAAPTRWFATSEEAVATLQDRLSKVMQHAEGVCGLVYTDARESSTSQFRVDFQDDTGRVECGDAFL